ncbi:MAG: hypothetical protein JSS95_06895 [Acidobacteria bacterium]|nr:hypothetical protein [Acidobacteriota bacterium]
MEAFIHTIVRMVARGWTNFLARPEGRLSLRFYLQPAMAILLAIRAGISDVREGRHPLLTSIVWHPERRHEALRSSWKHLRNVFIMSVLLDVVYQLITHHSIYILELLFTACCLAILPYAVVRGPVYRIVWYLKGSKSLANPE